MYTWKWFFGKFSFLVALIIGVLMPAWKTPRRKYFWVRLIISCLIFLGFTFAYEPLDELIIKSTEPFGVFWTYFLFGYILSIFLVWACFDCTIISALFCATMGYSMEHFFQRMYYATFFIPLKIKVGSAADILFSIGINAAGYLATYFFVFRKNKYVLNDISVDYLLQIYVSAAAVIFLIILNSETMLFIDSTTGLILSCIFSALCAALIFIMQFTMLQSKHTQNDLEKLNAVLAENKAQYEAEKLASMAVNVKAHDLRHQIGLIKNGDAEEIESVTKILDEYDGYIKTGSEAIDTVLAKYNPIFTANKIKFTCFIDGSTLDFIPAHELYALFGNVIENAVNAVIKIPEEKRDIAITQKQVGNIITIREVNYFDGESKIEKGMPVTSGDKNIHGFGTRSIKLIAEKYGGTVKFVTEEDKFIVEILVVNE